MENFLKSNFKRNFLSSSFLVSGIALALLLPNKSHLTYPLFYLSMLILKEKDTELRFIIIVLSMLLALFLPKLNNLPVEIYSVLIAEMLILWVLTYISYEHCGKNNLKISQTENTLNETSLQIEDMNKHIDLYKTHSLKTAQRLAAGKIFLDSFKNIQEKINAEDIMQEVKTALEKSFEGSKIEIKTSAIKDAASDYAYKSKISVLVKNTQTDTRFKKGDFNEKEKSIIAVPVLSFNSVIAIAKIISDTANKFNESDLRTSELLIRSAAIGMENLLLFKQINDLAMKDALTGLLTHRAFQDKLDNEILTSGRTKQPFCLIIADIDHFKKYNDTYGHQAGDEVLKKAAAFFASKAREVDTVARYGGEEFAFIMPFAFKKDAFQFAENIRSNLALIKLDFNSSSSITASFGISEFSSDASTKSQLIRKADERLYKAKRNGRNRSEYE